MFSRSKATSTKSFAVAIVTTATIVIIQLILFHIYIGFNIFDENHVLRSDQDNQFKLMINKLDDILKVSQQFNLEIVLIDPHLLSDIEYADSKYHNPKRNIKATSNQKRNQEHQREAVVHLAIVNETSGGQPNIKMFTDALKASGYSTLQFHEKSSFVGPEIYTLPIEKLDSLSYDGIKEQHNHLELYTQSFNSKNQGSKNNITNYISKVYTEFLSHLFILDKHISINNEGSTKSHKQLLIPTDASHQHSDTTNSKVPILKVLPFVIHVLVLYNFEFNPATFWVQPALSLSDQEKHTLLSYSVHSFDFKIPLEYNYLHRKLFTKPIVTQNVRSESIKVIRAFHKAEQETQPAHLSFVNNSFIECRKENFNIVAQIQHLHGEHKLVTNYLIGLDKSAPLMSRSSSYIRTSELENLIDQLATAMQFMTTYSSSYSNFSFWLTGSSLLNYHKFCNLVVDVRTKSVSENNSSRFKYKLNENNDDDYMNYQLLPRIDLMINIEIGVYENEFGNDAFEDLASSREIGVVIISKLSKDRLYFSFRLKECRNIVFHIYLYSKRNLDYESALMTNENKFVKSYSRNKRQPLGRHIFLKENLILCLTHLADIGMFRVPCNINDHLSRIYIN